MNSNHFNTLNIHVHFVVCYKMTKNKEMSLWWCKTVYCTIIEKSFKEKYIKYSQRLVGITVKPVLCDLPREQ